MDTRDVVKLGIALITTIPARVLSLSIASARARAGVDPATCNGAMGGSWGDIRNSTVKGSSRT